MKAPDFDLLGVDGKRRDLAAVRGPKGLVVMFICNHCPYVKAVIDRIVRDCRDLSAQGVGSVAVMSNDPTEYPEDSFANMKRIAREKGFPFPYRLEETQDAGRISSASMAGSSCSTGAGSMPRAATRCRTRAASCSRRWCRSPTPASDQRSRSGLPA